VLNENIDELEEIIRIVAMLNGLYAKKIKSGKIPSIKLHFLRYIKQ
jgi:hypothetical protein